MDEQLIQTVVERANEMLKNEKINNMDKSCKTKDEADEWFTKPETLQLFIYCLLRANYEDTSWQGISIKKGSFVTSFDTLCIETKQTIQQLRTNLSRLKRTKEISTKSTNRYTIITICKYEDYQYTQQTNNKQTTNKFIRKTK